MKVTESGNLKHRKLPKEGYLHRITAKQGKYAGACASPRTTEIDITNTNEPFSGILFCEVMCKLWNRGTYGGVRGRYMD